MYMYVFLHVKVRTETQPDPVWGDQIQSVRKFSFTTPSGKTKVLEYENDSAFALKNRPLTVTKVTKTVKVMYFIYEKLLLIWAS